MKEPEILQHFEYRHLPEHLQKVSKLYHDMAHAAIEALPMCAELMAGLRKLLEAKDCFVRAARHKK